MELPVEFERVEGNFYCYNNQLQTLEGISRRIGGDLLCDHNLVPAKELKKTIK
ncbi:MAG: hypothetical protein ACTSPB_17255 [Candidatus Thorarchaeota archaeon]